MAKYRKVDTKIWNDKRFNSLSSLGKLAFLFILTHPNMTPLGAMRGTIEGLSSELKNTPLKAFQEVFSKSFIKYSAKDCFIWLPNFLKYNCPESPNVVKSWAGSWDSLPECDLKDKLFLHLKDYTKGLSKGFQEAFTKALPKTMPNQEQEQEQEQEQDKKKYMSDSIEYRLADFLYSFILNRNNGFKKPNLHSWAKHIDLMLRVDNRKPADIETVIKWCQQDSFWQNNILSTDKLRKQYDTLFMKMNKETPKQPEKIYEE